VTPVTGLTSRWTCQALSATGAAGVGFTGSEDRLVVVVGTWQPMPMIRDARQSAGNLIFN
jgi:hypothetical protein